MPGLQSIVSAWTKINHQNVEYIDERNGLHPKQHGVPSSGSPGQQQQQQYQHHHHHHQQGGGNAGGGVGVGGVSAGIVTNGGVIIDPRTNNTNISTYNNNNNNNNALPQPSLPSSSSLSSYSFTKNNNGGATADTNSLTATPPLSSHVANTNANAVSSSSAAVHNLAPPSQRYPLHHHAQHSQPQLSSHHQLHDSSLLAARSSSTMAPTSTSSSSSSRGQQQQQHRSSRRSSYNANQHTTSSHLHSQLESYGNNNNHHPNLSNPHHNHHHHAITSSNSSNNLTSFPPPPQAGADAILGRRKTIGGTGGHLHPDPTTTLVDHRRRNDPLLGEPPASLLSSNNASPPYALSRSSTSAATSAANNRGGGGGGMNKSLERSPSSSLWHSTHSLSSSKQSNSSSSNNISGGTGTSSNISGGTGTSSSGVTASLDKMDATFKNVQGGTLLNGGGGLRGPTLTSSTASIAELNASAENALQNMHKLSLNAAAAGGMQQQNQQNPVSNNLAHSNFNPTTLPSSLVQQRSQRRKKKLIRSHSRADLAREMALDRHNTRGSGSSGSSSKRGITPRTEATSTTSASGAGTSSSSSSRVAKNSVSSIDELDVSKGSMLSQQMSQQQQQQQQQPQSQSSQLLQADLLRPQQRPLSRTPSFLSSPTTEENNGLGLNIARKPISGLNDSLIRNGPPGDHWMQDWFPNQPPSSSQPLTSNTRQSSAGSSGTDITGNTGNLGGKMGGSDSINNTRATFPEKQPPPTASGMGGNDNNVAMTPSHPLPSKQPQIGGACTTTNCERCAQMEIALLSLHADLEYLRTLDLQREFPCNESENASGTRSVRLERRDSSSRAAAPINKNTLYPNISSQRSDVSIASVGSRGSRASSRLHQRRSDNGQGSIGTHRTRSQATRFSSRTSMFLRDASKRLSDLSTRHKRQVKQTTHERAYWQNDMHLKLEKFAMMCKNLNEEAAHRSNEVKETKALLDKMTSERNTLVSEVDTLKARVELYEDENVEQSQLREEWSREKTEILDSIDRAVKDRDATTDDLTVRLELAVETIKNERKHHAMRRQIIFPSTRPPLERRDTDCSNQSAPASPHYRPNMVSECPREDDLERIQGTNEVAQKAQMSLKEAMLQNAKREKAMQLRLNAMERELADAKAVIDDNDYRREVASSGLELDMSIRRVSSTVSLGSAG